MYNQGRRNVSRLLMSLVEQIPDAKVKNLFEGGRQSYAGNPN